VSFSNYSNIFLVYSRIAADHAREKDNNKIELTQIKQRRTWRTGNKTRLDFVRAMQNAGALRWPGVFLRVSSRDYPARDPPPLPPPDTTTVATYCSSCICYYYVRSATLNCLHWASPPAQSFKLFIVWWCGVRYSFLPYSTSTYIATVELGWQLACRRPSFLRKQPYPTASLSEKCFTAPSAASRPSNLTIFVTSKGSA
jgi:hypothetical protein